MHRHPCFSVIVVLVTCTLLGAKKSNKREEPAKEQKAAEGVPPRDAQWTIYCQAIAGPDHVGRANAFKQNLLDATKMKEWYVIHQEDQSVIYYGYYRTMNDARAKADRKAVDELKDPAGNKVLGGCMVVEISAPDPTAPPQER